MKRRATFALLAAAALALPALASAQAGDWREIQTPPLPAFVPQQPTRIVLPNGLVIFLQEDHELPLVRGTARIRGGSREEPAAKVGLLSVYGQVWRTGGTKDRTGDQLDDELEARGARVESGAGLDSTTLGWDCLKDVFDQVFASWLELLLHPEFREEKIALAKNQIDTGIARRNDDASQIASREARKLGYGADSPYARVRRVRDASPPSPATTSCAWHQAHVHPNNVILGVVGDFDPKAMAATLRKALAAWPRGPAAVSAAVPLTEPRPGVYFVPKDDVTQSNIRMLHAGIRRDNPDYFAVEVMNEVFGGGFSARLFSSIRTKKGLAYSVGGGVGSSFDYRGLFQLGHEHQERLDRGAHRRALRGDRQAAREPRDAGRARARQGLDPQLVRLQLRHPAEGAARSGCCTSSTATRPTSSSATAPGSEGDGRRRGPRRARVRPQGQAGAAGGGQGPGLRPPARVVRARDDARRHDSGARRWKPSPPRAQRPRDAHSSRAWSRAWAAPHASRP